MKADSALVVVLVALLSSSLLATVITWIKDRHKTSADAELTSVTALQTALRALHDELVDTRAEMDHLRHENKQLRRSIEEL